MRGSAAVVAMAAVAAVACGPEAAEKAPTIDIVGDAAHGSGPRFMNTMFGPSIFPVRRVDVDGGELVTGFKYDDGEASVDLYWRLFLDGTFFFDEDRYATASFEISGPLTGALVLEDGVALVAGRSRSEGLFLERWGFAPGRLEDGRPVVGEPPTVERLHAFDGADDHGDLVNLWHLRGAPDSLLAHSPDGGALMTIDVVTGAVELVASSGVAADAPPIVPALERGWPQHVGPDRHLDLGFVYRLSNHSDVAPSYKEDREPMFLVFLDRDEDAHIDEIHLLTPKGYADLGLRNWDRYDEDWARDAVAREAKAK